MGWSHLQGRGLTNALPWDAKPGLCPVLLPVLACQVASRKVLARVTIPDLCKLHLCLVSVDLLCHPYRLQGSSRGHSSSPLKPLLRTPVAPCCSPACFLHPRRPLQVLMGAPLRMSPFAFFSWSSSSLSLLQTVVIILLQTKPRVGHGLPPASVDRSS